MKKIDNAKIEKIKEKHFKYCKKLRPNQKHKIDDNTCWLLCCENPFDFNNNHPNKDLQFLKQEYWEYVKNKNISYKNQYESFRTLTEANSDWNGVKLIEELGVDVCPYCGLNYISSVEKKDGKIMTIASLDHYLPKADKYAFLALNLYNLIPVCKNCNSTFKGKMENRILNPYFYAVEDDITFKIKNDTLIEYLLNDKAEPELEIIYNPDNEMVYNHCNILALQERYSNFKNIMKSLINKRYKYNKEYLMELKKVFKNFSRVEFENSIVQQDIYSNDEILSKFKKDIWEQISMNMFNDE